MKDNLIIAIIIIFCIALTVLLIGYVYIAFTFLVIPICYHNMVEYAGKDFRGCVPASSVDTPTKDFTDAHIGLSNTGLIRDAQIDFYE